MLSLPQVQQAAQLLVSRRANGTRGPRLPEDCRPTSLADAFAIQAAVTDAWCEGQDDSVGGWKCLLPSPDKLILAPIFTSTIHTIPPVALWTPSGYARVEPELAFVLGQDLPPRPDIYAPAEVDAAIARTHMALELIDSRYQDPATVNFVESLADGLVNQGLFIGPEVDGEQARLAGNLEFRRRIAGEQEEVSGAHPNQDPRAPLYWLAEFLRGEGEGLVAGQVVITGSYAGIWSLPLKQDIRIEYLGLGEMVVHFIAR